MRCWLRPGRHLRPSTSSTRSSTPTLAAESDKGRADLARFGIEAGGGTPVDFKNFMAAEAAKCGPIIKAAKIGRDSAPEAVAAAAPPMFGVVLARGAGLSGTPGLPARSESRASRGLAEPLALRRAADLVEDRRIVDRRRHRPGLAVGDLLHRAAQNLAGARLRQALDHDRRS